MVNHGPSYIDAYEAGKRVMTWRNDPEAIGHRCSGGALGQYLGCLEREVAEGTDSESSDGSS